jgi:hypothetical protein
MSRARQASRTKGFAFPTGSSLPRPQQNQKRRKRLTFISRFL